MCNGPCQEASCPSCGRAPLLLFVFAEGKLTRVRIGFGDMALLNKKAPAGDAGAHIRRTSAQAHGSV
jgi:hypothetical protein